MNRADLVAKLRKLIAMFGSDYEAERRKAHEAASKLLKKHGLGWHDVSSLLQADTAAHDPPPDDGTPASWDNAADVADNDAGPKAADVIGNVVAILKNYLQLTAHEFIAVALWIAHSHCFSHFTVTPRLALISPVRGCGKTTVLTLLQHLCQKAERLDNVSGASVYHDVDAGTVTTLLVDEADTLDLKRDRMLRGIFNSGWRHGGKVGRAGKKYRTFAPVALAAIGTDSLPLTLLDRSIIINMVRADGTHALERFDEFDPDTAAKLHAARWALQRWAATVKLDRNPAMQLRNRPADNWRVLLAIADSLGGEWGAVARATAKTLSAGLREEDPAVLLLSDIRTIFDARSKIDRIGSAVLVRALLALEDSPWTEWRGVRDDQHPRNLNQVQLAQALRLFGIRPRSIWSASGPGTKRRSRKGYLKAQFTQAWQAYCDAPPGAGPAQRPPLRVVWWR